MAAESPSSHEAGDLLGQVLSHPSAQDATESLRKDGFDLWDRSDRLTHYVSFHLRLYTELANTGKPSPYIRSSRRNIRALPEKLRTLAGELETRDCRSLTAHGIRNGLAPESLSDLPAQMREAAAFLEATIARGKVGPARKDRADIQHCIERIVKFGTRSRKPHRKEISQLLRLACQLAGKGDIEIDPDDMKQAGFEVITEDVTGGFSPRSSTPRGLAFFR